MFAVLLFLLFVSGAVTVISFILYVMARAREEEKREHFYRSIHYISLALFTIFGVLELIVVSQSHDFG